MAKAVENKVTEVSVYDPYMKGIPHALESLTQGYVDYAKEVILERAIPSIDGFKPSQRRILYAMRYLERDNDLTKDLTKCGGIAGTVMKIHPHGDASIYETMVRMTDCSLYLNTPFIKGKGSFGHVFSSDEKAAASRYTECMFMPIALECFKGMDGIEMIPSYDNKLMEPVSLPVSFPVLLCNPSSGIAVGMATEIPAFNFHEVNKAVISYIKTGKVPTLCPDFTTGGYYVEDKKELKALMDTGNAKLKLRGKWHIEGKIIVIDEIPYYTTVEEIKDAIENLDNVRDVKDECDRSGFRLTIACSNKKVVDSVLQEVLRVSKLQMTVTTNIVVVVDNKPLRLGVADIVKHWVNYRTEVLRKAKTVELGRLNDLIIRYDILVDIMTTPKKRDAFLDTLLHSKGNSLDSDEIAEVKKLLRSWYKNTPEVVFDWILERTLRSLKGVGDKQRAYLEQLRADRDKCLYDLEHLGECIIAELQALNKQYSFPRRTEVTTQDYTFEAKARQTTNERRAASAETDVVLAVSSNGMFLQKMKPTPTAKEVPGAVTVSSDSMVSYLHPSGALLRVYLEDVPYCTPAEKGFYVPRYFEGASSLPDGFSVTEDFKFIDCVVVEHLSKPAEASALGLDGVSCNERGYVLSDGNIIALDYGEWCGITRRYKVIAKGVAPKHIETRMMQSNCAVSLQREWLVFETVSSKGNKYGIESAKFLRKGRLARTKILKLGSADTLNRVVSVTDAELKELFTNPKQFMDTLKKASAEAFDIGMFDRLHKERENEGALLAPID